ncbi:ras-domain-containing protein [Daldinia bambusicola]|nr:ras-domain-containing protein [Daldinia bambusicola]
MPPSRQGRYQPAREFHVVVLGAAQFVHNEWIESYDPTIEDSYRTQVAVDGRQVVLEILDTAGTEQFVAMRDLYMKTGQGFLLVYSITSSSSLTELAGLRDEIIRIKDDATVPIVICGNKADLEDQRSVPRTKGFQISERWGAPYYEASARTRSECIYPHCFRISSLLPILDTPRSQGNETNIEEANVDEVFIDLCRQMLRKYDTAEPYAEDQDKFDPYSISSYKKRRRGKDGERHRPRCVIL